MKILITGIDGFLGRHIAATLLTGGHELYGISNGAFFGERVGFRKVDITDRAAVLDAVQWSRPDLCIHLAAMANPDVAPEKHDSVRCINTEGSVNLIDALVQAGCGGLIFFSTVKVLGETAAGGAFDEDDTPAPEGIYAQTKYEVEQYLQQPAIAGALPWVVVRPVPVVGPGDTKGNYVKMLAMVERGFFPLIGGGMARRSIVFADTVAERICNMVDRGIIAGRTYVFSDGAFTLEEIINAMRTAAGFSFCPAVDGKIVELLETIVDGVLNRLKSGKTPVASIRQRFNFSYAVHARRFEADYGPRPPVVLHEKMKDIIEHNRGMGKGRATDAKLLRSLDIILSGTGLWVTAPLLVALFALGLLDTGSPLFIQGRVGRGRKPFRLIKFRTMKKDTASVASHLANNDAITPFGHFLRRTKLDELPQLINVLKGDMSMVGPRPNLFNQEELIAERDKRGVYDVAPGITGLAQTSGIDMSTPELLARTDEEMINDLSLRTYLRYIVRTALGGGTGDAVKKDSGSEPS